MAVVMAMVGRTHSRRYPRYVGESSDQIIDDRRRDYTKITDQINAATSPKIAQLSHKIKLIDCLVRLSVPVKSAQP